MKLKLGFGLHTLCTSNRETYELKSNMQIKISTRMSEIVEMISSTSITDDEKIYIGCSIVRRMEQIGLFDSCSLIDEDREADRVLYSFTDIYQQLSCAKKMGGITCFPGYLDQQGENDEV